MNQSSPEFVPAIRAALERGQRLRVTPTGISMQPFLYDGEVVELEACARPRVGDIVMVCDAQGCYVLHRVVRIVNGAYYTAGDAQGVREGPFDGSALLGRAVVVYRGERTIRLDRGASWLAGRLWLACGPRGHAVLLWIARRRAVCREFLRRLRTRITRA